VFLICAQAARYTSRHREVMEGGATVFSDAAEEYATLEAVKQRLEEYKLRCALVGCI